MFFILERLNTEFRELFLPVFSFQISLFNDTFVNTLKTVGLLIRLYVLYLSNKMRKLSLSSNKKLILLLYSSIKKKKNTCTDQTHNYVYSRFKICYLKHGTKQIFFVL